MPIQTVQQFAGHSHITTTQRYYLAVRPEDIEVSRRTLNVLLESE